MKDEGMSAPMRLPCWLVVILLSTSVLTVLGYAGWWWVTWPERTFDTYARLYAEFKRDDVAELAATTYERDYFLELGRWARYWGQYGYDNGSDRDIKKFVRERSWADLIVGRQTFRRGEYVFNVHLGRVHWNRLEKYEFEPLKLLGQTGNL